MSVSAGLRKLIPGTRLPIYFPNMVLKAMPLSEEGLEAVSKGEMPPVLKFRTAPSVGTRDALPRLTSPRLTAARATLD